MEGEEREGKRWEEKNGEDIYKCEAKVDLGGWKFLFIDRFSFVDVVFFVFSSSFLFMEGGGFLMRVFFGFTKWLFFSLGFFGC